MGAKSRVPEHLRRLGAAALDGALRVLKPAALPGAVLAIYCAGTWCLWDYAARHAGRPGAPEVDSRGCPWLSSADLAVINAGVDLAGQSSLFDRQVCRQVAHAYRGSPWVEQVVAVRRHFPDRVDVELAIRRPAAYVHRGGLYYLVDRSGCRLPVSPVVRPEATYPVVEGAIAAPPAAGETWNDECLDDSLRLAELLNEVLAGRGPGARLALVRAAKPARGYDTRPQMLAQTASGLEIDWGSFNESRTYAFPSVSDKRAELERQLRLIPDLSAISCIRVRYRGGGVIRRPELTAEAGPIGLLP